MSEQSSNNVVNFNALTFELKDKEIAELKKGKLSLEDQLNAKDVEVEDTKSQLNNALSRLSEISRQI